ncbi:unnamed protein product [Phyllotreta striolata]|uniref:Nose resistant-to-fluoxetine protein N-terminal domain-containing protein n=1 Tax=Phyllotreta striolata TaxID=444603 RepID=A0A9N9TN05_PHYSR|nr:unnamed protein product [Phyllotreta striolata]
MLKHFVYSAILLSSVSCGPSFKDFLHEDIASEIFPKLGDEGTLCRNHTQFYLQQLDNAALWASEMYDASGKVPSGVLYGSGYSLGQFDQCLDIEVPQEAGKFAGKYCMTRISVAPNFKYKMKEIVDYEFGKYGDFYNVSAFSKMLAYSKENSKASRSEIYLSLCIPSSCTESDLNNSLKIIENDDKFDDFTLTFDTFHNSCRVKSVYVLSTGDISFLILIAVSVGLVMFCSLYDIFTRGEGESKPGKLHAFFLCFSVPKNLKKLATGTNNEDGLDCLAGVKVLSMFLIIMGHRCMFIFGAPISNPLLLEKMYSRFEAALILNGPIIVDTFFVISGFLASYFTLCAVNDRFKFTHVFVIYIHRLLRMTPTYAVVLAFYCTIFYTLSDGPFWQERIGVEKERCSENWWTNLLYINNYVNADKLCMFQSWYIACDMHYFLLIPPLAIVLKKYPTLGVSVVVLLIASSILVVITSVYVRSEGAILLLYMKLLKDPISNSTFKNTYIPTHMRASPYFVGALTGYAKYKMKVSAYKLPKWLYRSAWVAAIVTILATIQLGFVFYLPEFAGSSFVSAAYAGFHHFTFSLGNAWLIIGVSSGKGSWIEPILSWKPFVLLSRISYSAFLCHGAVQFDIVMAYCFGFLLTMVFEAPIIGLEKLLFGKRDVRKLRETGQPGIIEQVRIESSKK